MKTKTLIVAAHCDDETFGLHGYLQRFQNIENIHVIVLSSSHTEETEMLRRKICCEILNKFNINYSISLFKACSFDAVRNKISNRIELEINNFQPNKVLIPSENELHQDHKLVNHICKVASKPSRHNFIQEILEYSVPESEQFSATYYDTVLELSDEEHKLKKLNADKYSTEYIPQIPNSEKFRTIFRRL